MERSTVTKRALLILSILALGLIGATKIPTRLVRLTVVNMAERKVEISMTGRYFEEFYYLHVPEGSRIDPYIQVYTIVPDSYSTSLYYWELWDPVYGNQCGTKAQNIELTRNVRLIVLPCNLNPPNGGEPPSILKYGGQNLRRRR
jgi:hypothetical protein